MADPEIIVDDSEKLVEPGETPAVETPAAVETKPASKMSNEELETLLNKEPADTSTNIVEKGEEEESAKKEALAKGKIDPNDEPGDTETLTADDIKALVAENKRLLKKAENQDKYIDRVGTEVGLLRKKTPEEDKVELERIRDIYIDDPIAGQEAYAEYKANQDKAETVGREVEVNRRIETNKTGIESLIPEFETNQSEIVEELAALMTEDGAPAAAVAAFKEQPFLMDQATMYNLHLRNTIGKESKEKDAKITELETQIEELKKKPGELLSNIEKASKNQTLTGKSAGAVPANSATITKPVSKRTNEELDKLING